MEDFLAEHRGAPFVVLDSPLLFEKGGWKAVDKIAVVSAPTDIQKSRVLSRPDMTEEKFEAIRALQIPDSEKRARADFVIETGGSFDRSEEHTSELQSLMRISYAVFCLKKKSNYILQTSL